MPITNKGMIQYARETLIERLAYWEERSKFYENQLILLLMAKDDITPRQIFIPLECPYCHKPLGPREKSNET
jgi:hypothetical protein